MSEVDIYKGIAKNMKDNDIKEIINYFKDDINFLEQELKNPNFLGRFITIKDKEYNYLKILLNYITNLQEKLNQYEKEDYKARCEKAVEYLEKPYRDNFDYSKAELLNILNGRSDE